MKACEKTESGNSNNYSKLENIPLCTKYPIILKSVIHILKFSKGSGT